jgi:hypothetical protein
VYGRQTGTFTNLRRKFRFAGHRRQHIPEVHRGTKFVGAGAADTQQRMWKLMMITSAQAIKITQEQPDTFGLLERSTSKSGFRESDFGPHYAPVPPLQGPMPLPHRQSPLQKTRFR